MNRSSWYIFWFLGPLLLGVFSAHPELAILAVVALVAHPWLPDPYLFFKHAARIRSLQSQIEANPHNAEAQRELVRIYLDKGQAAKAIPLATAALARDPDSAELNYLHGMALLSAKRPEEAIAPLRAAIGREPKLRYGEANLRLGDAFATLQRHEEAQRAYAAFLDINSSAVEGHVKLGRTLRALGDAAGAKQALDEARATWRQLPGFLRRQQWMWAARAYWGG